MTDWVAVSVDLHDDARVSELASILGISKDAVIARLVRLWGRMARQGNELGDVGGTPDALLEGWADWRGKAGKFAAAFRQVFTEDGVVRNWWKWNGRHLRAARLERERKQRIRGGGHSPDVPPDSPPDSPPDNLPPVGGSSSGNTRPDQTGPNQTTDADQLPAVRVAISANTGLRSNPLVRGFNELVPGQAITHVTDWIAQGIPLPLICETVQSVASRFKPTPGNEQPSSFGYFDKPIRQAHARAAGKSLRVTTPTPSRLRNLA